MTHGSLFSGIGGFELGALWAGIPTLWNCEIEEYQRKILKLRFPDTKQYEDIKKVEKPEYVDIISGGFPCQDISIANTNAKGIQGTRSGLWSEMHRICRNVKPRYIIIENSSRLTVRGLEKVLFDLSEIGFNAEWQSLSASSFGFPHQRERIFIIAYSDKIGCEGDMQEGIVFKKSLPKWTPGQANIPLSIERFNSKSDFESIRMDNGFPDGLDKVRIESCGNAVIPFITKYLFECVKELDEKLRGGYAKGF